MRPGVFCAFLSIGTAENMFEASFLDILPSPDTQGGLGQLAADPTTPARCESKIDEYQWFCMDFDDF